MYSTANVRVAKTRGQYSSWVHMRTYQCEARDASEIALLTCTHMVTFLQCEVLRRCSNHLVRVVPFLVENVAYLASYFVEKIPCINYMWKTWHSFKSVTDIPLKYSCKQEIHEDASERTQQDKETLLLVDLETAASWSRGDGGGTIVPYSCLHDCMSVL